MVEHTVGRQRLIGQGRVGNCVELKKRSNRTMDALFLHYNMVCMQDATVWPIQGIVHCHAV